MKLLRKYLKMNVQKIKAMVVCREGGDIVNIIIDGEKVEQVASFKYL